MPAKADQNGHEHSQQHSNPTVTPPGVEGMGPVGNENLDLSLLQRSVTDPTHITPRQVQGLQRSVGNRVATTVVQRKLMVGSAGDRYEQEADRVAESVVRSPEATPSAHAIQAKSTVQRDGGEGGFEAGADVENQLATSKGGGSPLASDVRSFMEPRFGADFSGVRVHTGSESAQLNRQLDAQAFTHGKDIYMGEGKYSPDSDSGKVLLAHELTHVVQQTGGIHRWSENEHKSFGDLAAAKASTHDWKFTLGGKKPEEINANGVGQKATIEAGGNDKEKQDYAGFMANQVDPLKKKLMEAGGGADKFGGAGVGVQNAGGNYMSFGDATMMGGDYFKTAEATGTGNSAGLAQADNINPLAQATRMTFVASTNTNHFFPLAGLEWRTQYAKAQDMATEANLAYKKGEKAEGDSKAASAFRFLGVAVHFLQDTFASGHQYPRALDDIDSVTAAGIATEGASTAKTYHDALCALPNGINMKYEGNRRFHGDTTADGTDFPVVTESYRAISRILSIISGKALPDDAQEVPQANPGPNVGEIMKDPEAGPLWSSMTKATEGKKETLEGKAGDHWYNSLRQTNFTTSAGTPYTAKYIKEEMDKLDPSHAPTSTVEKLVHAAMGNQATLAHGATRGTSMTAVGKSTNTSADDEINTILSTAAAPAMTHNQVVMVLGALVTGRCSGADEASILKILAAQSDAIVLSAIREITPAQFESGIDGENWDSFLALWTGRGSAGSNPGADYTLQKQRLIAARKIVHDLGPDGKGRLSADQWGRMQTLAGEKTTGEKVEAGAEAVGNGIKNGAKAVGEGAKALWHKVF